jgi:vacuolar-type H+-ATPase subunit E/Vma4
MALSDLISRLEQEAQSRVEAIRREADAEVRTIEAETERSVEEITTRQLERGCAARRVDHERELARARRQARTRELEALRAQIDRILSRARALLPEIAASPAYVAVLPSHLEEALRFLEGLHPQVRCQSAFAPLLQPIVARCDGATLVVDDTVGPGIVAEASDGSVSVDNTLAARLARNERRLTIELTRTLQGRSSPPARGG